MLGSESSEGGYSVEFPSGTAAAEGRKDLLHFEGERDRQKRGVRESVDYDSGPRTTWQWRREGEITHQSMWNLIQLSQD